jgi:hypothetical protein
MQRIAESSRRTHISHIRAQLDKRSRDVRRDPGNDGSQPISRVACVILMKLLATPVSTLTTPLMSITKTRAWLSGLRQDLLHDVLVRCSRQFSQRVEEHPPRSGNQVDISSIALPLSAMRRLAVRNLIADHIRRALGVCKRGLPATSGLCQGRLSGALLGTGAEAQHRCEID